MGCESCGSSNGLPNGCQNNGWCTKGGCQKLSVYDWLSNMQAPSDQTPFNIVEVRFKGTRKGFYRNEKVIDLSVGDMVAVEATSGHDIGEVSITGELVRLQMKKRSLKEDSREIKKIYRTANQKDLDKWESAKKIENDTLFRTRKIITQLGLNMKLGDVEYQGDRTKATFSYTAEERVDFRNLIKKLAEEFKLRIEMKQIGARQEAGLVGGIGSCGRELCCSSWLTNFKSVSTSAARYQNLSLNPLKLAGQCGKLKCCLNYELDTYMDALRGFPDLEKVQRLETQSGTVVHQKTDIFKKIMWYGYEDATDWHALSISSVKNILEMNKKGKKPSDLSSYSINKPEKQSAVQNVLEKRTSRQLHGKQF